MIDNDLRKYIRECIFPCYERNDEGHNLNHIKYVIERSLKFAHTIPNIDYNMVYTIASYHDVGHFIDAKNHEKVSAKILLDDINLKNFFNEEQINIMADAVYDHRASMEGEPRTIYGKIVSSADRNTSIIALMKRTYAYRLNHNPEYTLDEIIEESRKHILDKFWNNGYAIKKMYFKDDDYDKMIKEINILANDKDLFKQKFIEINEIKIKNK